MSGEHILLIDRAASTRAALEREVLVPAGYTTSFTDSAYRLPEGDFSAILLSSPPPDQIAPALDALSASLPSAPVILLSWEPETSQNACAGLRLGAAEVLFAPFQPDVLLAALRRAVVRGTRLKNWASSIANQTAAGMDRIDGIRTTAITNISHELRSPLTAILGYVELIARVGEVNAQQHEFIRRVQSSVRHITGLIDDLIELERITSGQEKDLRPVSLNVIILEAANGLAALWEQKQQRIDLDGLQDLPPVSGRPARLHQLVRNLLDNAHKYTPERGTITLSGWQEAGQVVLQVRDTGIGIPAAELPFIFNSMYRASNVPEEVVGSGLGLSIVRSIVEDHGGRIWCDSIEGEGTTITVVLPGLPAV